MQFDMHYYGTYAMAAAAGIPPEDAEVIATSAQFVDDQSHTTWSVAQSGQAVLGVATAHHPVEAGVRTFFKSAEGNDTRLVWVPFHFLPGAEGDTFRGKMRCQKDSRVVNDLLDFYLTDSTLEAHRDHALHLMGIAAHVYADTFSHYGFSGLSDEINQVEKNSLAIDVAHSPGILFHLQKQKENFLQMFTDAASLGHGSVFTNPDRPYLKWSFKYRDGVSSNRDNPATFLEACAAMYRRFSQFASIYYEGKASAVTAWEDLEGPVKKIIGREGVAEERVRFWAEAMGAGELGGISPCSTYTHLKWMQEIESVPTKGNVDFFVNSNAYKFLVAADYHRGYVLKRLLPKHGLLVA